jgi:hypothetical protein
VERSSWEVEYFLKYSKAAVTGDENNCTARLTFNFSKLLGFKCFLVKNQTGFIIRFLCNR